MPCHLEPTLSRLTPPRTCATSVPEDPSKAQIGKISYSNLKTKPRSSLVVLCLGLGTFIALTWVQFLVGELRSTSHLLSLGLIRCYLQLTLPTLRSKPSNQTAGSSSDMVFLAAHFGLFRFLCLQGCPPLSPSFTIPHP